MRLGPRATVPPPRAALAWGIALAAGCGRVGFDATGGDGAAIDARPADAPLPGAVLWLRMDDSPDDGAIDSAAGHVALCDGGCPALVAGHAGSGYAFAATPLVVAFRADLGAAAGYTVAAWVALGAVPGDYACLVSKPLGANERDTYALCVDSTGHALYYSADAAGDDYLAGPAVPLNQWHHLAMTHDGARKRGYFDGVEVGVVDVAVGWDDHEVIVGGDRNGGSAIYGLDGTLDEVIVFDRALAAPELAALAQ